MDDYTAPVLNRVQVSILVIPFVPVPDRYCVHMCRAGDYAVKGLTLTMHDEDLCEACKCWQLWASGAIDVEDLQQRILQHLEACKLFRKELLEKVGHTGHTEYQRVRSCCVTLDLESMCKHSNAYDEFRWGIALGWPSSCLQYRERYHYFHQWASYETSQYSLMYQVLIVLQRSMHIGK